MAFLLRFPHIPHRALPQGVGKGFLGPRVPHHRKAGRSRELVWKPDVKARTETTRDDSVPVKLCDNHSGP